MTSWFSVDKLKLSSNYDSATEEFGVWSRTKRYLARRWLSELAVLPAAGLAQASQAGDLASLQSESISKDLGAVGELLAIATPVAIAELDPTAASRLQKRIPIERLRSLSPTKSDGGGSARPSSEGGNSGVMVEEKGPSEDERSGDEQEKERRRKQRLKVPFETAK